MTTRTTVEDYTTIRNDAGFELLKLAQNIALSNHKTERAAIRSAKKIGTSGRIVAFDKMIWFVLP